MTLMTFKYFKDVNLLLNRQIPKKLNQAYKDKYFKDGIYETPLHEYVEAIKTGKIISCENIKREINRIDGYLNDDQIIIDMYDGMQAIAYIEKYCLLENGANFKLSLWQKAIIWVMFALKKEIETDEYDLNNQLIGTKKEIYRAVNEIFIMLPSGNGKTTLLAGISKYILYKQENVFEPEIFIGSCGLEEASNLYKLVAKMIQKDEKANSITNFRHFKKELEVRSRGALLQTLTSSGGEGKNPSLIIIDEVHTIKDMDYVNDLKKSTKRSGINAAQCIQISTNGHIRGYYFDKLYEDSLEILHGRVNDDGFHPFLYELDDESEMFDKKCWLKAHPNLGISVDIKTLNDKVEKVKNESSEATTVKCKSFNIPQTKYSVYFSEQECKPPGFDESIFDEDLAIFIGIDHAFTREAQSDFSNIKFGLYDPFKDELFVKSVYLMPEYFKKEDGTLINAILAKSKEDEIGYDKFLKNDQLVVLRGKTMVTQEDVQEYIINFLMKHNSNVFKIGLDATNLLNLETYFNAKAQDNKFCVRVWNQKRSFNTPRIETMKRMRKDCKIFCNNKIDTIQFANSVAKLNKDDEILLDTLVKRHHNDGVIAELCLITALELYFGSKATGFTNLETYKQVFLSKKIDLSKYKSKDAK